MSDCILEYTSGQTASGLVSQSGDRWGWSDSIRVRWRGHRWGTPRSLLQGNAWFWTILCAREGEPKRLLRWYLLTAGDAEADEASSGGAGRGGHAHLLEVGGFFENGFHHAADLAPAVGE
jgi:hypothetical protein